MDELQNKQVRLWGRETIILDPSVKQLIKTYATTCADCDLDGVPARLADLLQIQRTMRVLVLASVNFQWR
jgi:hypothetical protein